MAAALAWLLAMAAPPAAALSSVGHADSVLGQFLAGVSGEHAELVQTTFGAKETTDAGVRCAVTTVAPEFQPLCPIFDYKAPADEAINCAMGKLLPEFYVLGAKNTATTSLYNDLNARGVVAAPGGAFKDKEWQFFKRTASLPEVRMGPLWLQSLPTCPETRQVMADFSVTNLFVVPLPSDLTWSKELGYPAKNSQQPPDLFDSARHIRQFHFFTGGRTPRFVILLREPLEHAQSEYYHTRPLKNCLGCMANSTFPDSLLANTALLRLRPPQVTDWMWKSFYSRQIEEYLKWFDPGQFYFVPFRQYIAVDPPAFSKSLLSWLGVEGEPWSEASHENEHSDRPPLDEELPRGSPVRAAFEAALEPENQRLARTLAMAHAQGARLAGFAGPSGDAAAVRAWLDASW